MEEELKLTEQTKISLLKAMKWLKFFAVLGVIGIFLLIGMAAIFMIIPGQMDLGGYKWIASVLYLIIALVYIYPVMKAFAIVSNTRKAINMNDQMSLELAAKDFHVVLKFCGVLTIIILVIYALILIGVAISIPQLAAL